MNEQEQRIAIAEWCGWQFKYSEYMHRGCVEIIRPDASHCTDWPIVMHDSGWLGYLPDYLNDLNAMHEAESRLNDEQKEKYMFTLITEPEPTFNNGMAWDLTHSTAIQRAEALLKTIGKWKEVK